MKRIRIILLTTLLLLGFAIRAHAEPTLSLGSVTGEPGETPTMTLSFTGGAESYAGVNARILLPSDVSVTGVSAGGLLAGGSFTVDYHTFTEGNNNGVAVIAYSDTGTFNANGALLNLNLQIANDASPGTYPAQFATNNPNPLINSKYALSNSEGSVSVAMTTPNNGTINIGCNGGNGPAPEICDGLDNDCDDEIDEGCDDDNDDYCDSSMTVVGTPAVCPHGGGDCNDGVATIHPGVTEICDGFDNNCAGGVDEGENTLCADGNLCNGTETCNGIGGCQTDSALNCNDINPCTNDSCEPATGCVNDPVPMNGNDCSDEDECTVNDICSDGECAGELVIGCRPTEFDVSVDITSPIRVCVEATQVCDEGGPAPVSITRGVGTLTPVADPCSNSSELIFCWDYDETNDSIGTIVEIQFEESSPCDPQSPGFTVARFEINTDHEYATSFCVTEEGGIISLTPNPCDTNNISVEVEIESGNLNLSNADQSICNGNGVLMSIVGIDPATTDLNMPNNPIAICDITLSDGDVSGTLTITLDFMLTDGATRSDYDSGSRVFEVFSCDGDCDNPANWNSLGTPAVTWASGSPDETEGTFTFTTTHLTKFAATSKQQGCTPSTEVCDGVDNDCDGQIDEDLNCDPPPNTQAADGGGGGGGCSVTSADHNMSIESVAVNTLIFFLPLIILGIRRGGRKML